MKSSESAWRDLFGSRPWWMNALFGFCAFMAFVYVPWDLFVKPAALDEEVWFGIRFEHHAAKLLALPHWAVYAAGTVGFLRMKRWMWPWAAVYTGQVAFSMLVWPLLYVGGVRGLLSGLVSGAFFGVVTLALWRSRDLFQRARPRLRDRYGAWALVTGASAGIGREFARALAREGMSVVLTARRADRLEELAAELGSRHGVETRCLALDLEQAGAAEQLGAQVSALEIGVLVNNAGFGGIGPYDAQDPARVRAMVELNCVAPAVVTRLLLPAMRERGRGAVIFVGSVAGMVPMPLHALYSATKAFDNHLGEALHEELRESGVDVLALEPGSTETEFQQKAGERPHPGESAREVVEKALAALGTQPSLVTGWSNWLRANAAVRLLSRPLLLEAVRRATAARLPDSSQKN
jgi:short-subunit dehydrogenase